MPAVGRKEVALLRAHPNVVHGIDAGFLELVAIGRSMDRARRGQCAVLQAEDLEEAPTRGQDWFPVRRVRQANRAKQGGRKAVNQTWFVSQLGYVQRRRDRLHGEEITNAGSLVPARSRV